ncbi:MAG: DUF3772 domain-containing protein [Hyphomicrobiaceae bacterium]|nr:DUF3772 domain-containing protein [Hyphomicrobiaceae bacterium]
MPVRVESPPHTATLVLAAILALLALLTPWTPARAGAASQAPPATKEAPDTAKPAPATAATSAEPAAPTAPEQAPAVVAPLPPPEPPPQIDDLMVPVREATTTIEAIEKVVERVKTSDIGLAQQRAQIDTLLAETEKLIEAIRPRLEAAKAQIAQLGPPPKAGQPPEAVEVQGERARLTALVTGLEGGSKSAELVRVRSRQLGTHIAELRQALFTQNLFERSGSPLLPKLWSDIAADSGRIGRQLDSVFGTWRAILFQRWWQVFSVLGGAAALYAALWMLTRRLLARLTPRSVAGVPAYTQRARAATIAAPLYVLPAVAAATVLYLGIKYFDLSYSRVDGLTLDVYQAILTFAVVSGLASAILTPRKPAWRLLDLSSKAAQSLWRSIRMIALIYGADIVLKEMIRLLDLPLVFHVALAFITTIAFAVVLLGIVATPFVPSSVTKVTDGAGHGTEPMSAAPPDAVPMRSPTALSRWAPRWLKIPLLLIALAIIAAALSGYIALARFAAGQVVITGSAIVLVILLHFAIRTSERTAVSTDTLLGSWLADGLGLGESHRSLIGHAISATLNIALAIVALPALMLAWGFSVADVMAGLRSVLFGFEIGHFRISLVRLFLALALFGALLFATRLLQRWLRGTFLRPDRMDAGIANSIFQGIGYVGFGFAALVAISFGGIDITNLAILAGALSVGIGFGLQSIVNNFVSGLILLVERPIKVGDWIVLKDGSQGYVRSISVRSTEIETFDRSSLIVPNSELISSVVTNWTHRNALGRVIVKVATSYKSDPDTVLAILAQCAKDTPSVMQQPAPLVTLDNFGGEGLEFTVRVVVPDINRGLSVQTELRSRIFKAFVQAGVEFPTAERDIYLRDLDGIKGIVQRAIEERARSAEGPAAAKPPGS